MTVKYTILGALIYLAMALDILAAVAAVVRLKKTAWAVFGGAFAASLAAVIWRGVAAGHFPASNLFEVFLCLSAVMFPLSLLTRYALGVSGQWANMLIAAAVLFPAGFVFSASPAPLPPALQSPLFVPHVACYMLAYAILAAAAVNAAGCLLGGSHCREKFDESAAKLTQLGFPLLTAGLVLGSVWGKRAWGDWWNFDPKELWSLAGWLVFAGYLYFRAVTGGRYRRANAVMVLAGAAIIVITLLWVNLSKIFAGLHSYA